MGRIPGSCVTNTLGYFLVVVVAVTTSTHSLKRNIMLNDPGNSVDTEGLSNLLKSLDFHLETFQKRTCAVGLQSHNCALSDLSKMMRNKAFLSSGHSPGKRSGTGGDLRQNGMVAPQDVMEEAKALQDDVTEQRKIILRLRNLLHALHQENGEGEERINVKRSCRFRLGGHCLTEELDRAASQFYYLKSPDSPGRRRRDTDSVGGNDDAQMQLEPVELSQRR